MGCAYRIVEQEGLRQACINAQTHMSLPCIQTESKNGLSGYAIDWLQSLKQFFINGSYHIRVASLTLMSLFY